MIGNLTPTLHKNSEDTTAFMRPYCSLCSSLRKQHGLPSSLLLNYELSFILLSLDPYIESTPIQTCCPSSAFTKMRPAYSHPAADLAANLSLVLGWLKTIDHIADTHQKISFSFLVKGLEKKLGKKVARIMENFSPETRQAILDYILVSKNSTEEIGNVRSKTFILSRQVALEIISTTTLPQADQQTYANFFGHLGASIALLDPLLDLEKDLEKKAYNPIIEKYEQEGQELSRHYLTFLHQYKEEHGKLKQQLTQQHLFPLSFIRVMTSGLDQNFKKIRKVTDRLFGHLEETLLDGMIGCNTTCQRCATHQKTKPTALAGLFLPFNGCGGGGSGCGGGNNCGSGCHGCGNSCNGCGNSCNGCGNSCNGCGNACNGCGNSCNGCGESCNAC